jgi:hypothetical protein
VAFLRPDNYIALVLMNCGDEDMSEVAINLINSGGGDDSQSRSVLTSIPAHSIQTYLVSNNN